MFVPTSASHFFAAAFFLVHAVVASSQDRLDPVGVGRARTATATARGLSALGTNPGGMHLPSLSTLSLEQDLIFSIYTMGGVLGTTLLNSDDFDQIFASGGGWPTQAERVRLGILLEGERLVANASNSLISVQWRLSAGTLGLQYAHRVFSRLDFPSDLTRVLRDNELFNQRYEIVNQGIGVDWITDLGLSYGLGIRGGDTWFPEIGIGATLKWLRGIAHVEVGENSILVVDRVTSGGGFAYHIRGGYTVRGAEPEGFDPANAVGRVVAGLFPAGAGDGIGATVGISGILWRAPDQSSGSAYFGMTLSDIGSIRWSSNTTLRHREAIDDVLLNATISDDQFRTYQGVLDTIPAYSTGLPTTIRAGIGFDLSLLGLPDAPAGIVEIDGELPLNQVPGNDAEPRASIGADLSLSEHVAVRCGISGWGTDGFGVGVGFGVKPWNWMVLDVGTAELDGILAGERMDIAFRLAIGLGD